MGLSYFIFQFEEFGWFYAVFFFSYPFEYGALRCKGLRCKYATNKDSLKKIKTYSAEKMNKNMKLLYLIRYQVIKATMDVIILDFWFCVINNENVLFENDSY